MKIDGFNSMLVSATKQQGKSELLSNFQNALDIASANYEGKVSVFNVSSNEEHSFSNMMINNFKSMKESVQLGELNSVQNINNEGSLADLIPALNEAEINLTATKTILEKAIGAYNEVKNMAI